MSNGNPSDVGYQPQGVPEALISGLINRKSKGAEGLNALNQSNLFPGLQQMTQQIMQANQRKKQQDQMMQVIQQLTGQGSPPPPQGNPQSMGPMTVPPGQPMSAGPGNIGQDVQMPKPPMPQQPMAQSPQMQGQQPFNGVDPSKLLGLYMKANPQGAQALIGQMLQKKMGLTSTKQASPWRVVPNTMTKSGRPIQQNEQTGEVREVPLDVKESSPRANAMDARTDYLNKSLDYRQRDLLNKNTNLPGVQLKTLTQNNMRADRALDLIGSPNVTWQKLNFAITDLGAIMQGGVPHKEQILDAQFPSWKQKVAQYKTFATGQPTANVPEPIRNEVVSMIQSLKKVDNEYLQQNMQNQMKMLGPTVQGFDKLKPIIEQGTQKFMQGTQQPKGAPYPDQGKEARYQEYLRSKNASPQ